jgi:predicted AlkP superfamily phosphohydrolase/phosphomutase
MARFPVSRPPTPRFVALAALLLSVAPSCGDPSLADVEPRDRKVLLLAIDGLDFAILEKLFENGQLPTLAALRERGIEVPLIGEQAYLDPYSIGLDPAETWTTVATGFPPTQAGDDLKVGHGVRDITVPMKDEYARAPTTTAHRQVPAVWQVLSAVGTKSAIVNWPVTWPAEPLDGYLVSDRFFHAKFGLTWLGEAGRVDLPEVPAALKAPAEHLTWPPELAEPHAAAVGAALGAPSPLLDGLRQLKSAARDATTLKNLNQFEQALRTDFATRSSLAQLLKADPSVDFAACYLESLDVACHLFWAHLDWQSWTLNEDKAIRDKLPRNYAEFARVIPWAAMALDAIVKDLLDAMGPETTVLIVSDHSLQPDAKPTNRDFSLNRLFARMGWLEYARDGSIDWSKTRCFDRTQWETSFIRHVSINFAGEWPQGCVPTATVQERGVRWSELQNQLKALKTNQPVRIADESLRPTLFWDMNMGDTDSHFVLYQTLPGATIVTFPDGTTATVDQLFPPRMTFAKHTSHAAPGTLLLSYPGELGLAYGQRGIPLGKGGGRCLHVAPLVLGLFGVPLSSDALETTKTADFLWWMLDVPEAQEMAIRPRVASYESLLRFNDPSSALGARRAEFRRYVEGLRYTFDQPATQVVSGVNLPTGFSAGGTPPEDATDRGVHDDADDDR